MITPSVHNRPFVHRSDPLRHILVEAPLLSDACSDLLKRIELGQVHGVTSSVALAEATHKVMLAEVVHRHGVPHQGLIARLKRHPTLLEGLTSHQQVAATVQGLPLHVEAVTLTLLAREAMLSTQHQLFTNDALTVAIMGHLGVTVLATNDDDFDTVPGLTVYKPPPHRITCVPDRPSTGACSLFVCTCHWFILAIEQTPVCWTGEPSSP